MSNREVVRSVISRVLEDKGLPSDVSDDAVDIGEGGLGLDSLDIATIAAELEEELDLDPFAHGDARMGTLGEFVALYEAEPPT
ncbi:MAG: acyl carrier protein [Acidimicrobiia bacterium]